MVVDVADADSPDLPDEAVMIREGETLCITGTIGPKQQLRALRVVADDEIDGPVLRFQLTPFRGGSQLLVRTRTDKVLRYVAAIVQGSINFTQETTTIPVSPGVPAHELWPGRIRRMLLARFRFEEPRAPQPVPDHATRRFFLGDGRVPVFSITMLGGLSNMHLHELNGSLQRYGFSTLPSNAPTLTALFEMQALRFRLGYELGSRAAYATDRSGSQQVSVDTLESGLVVSFDFIQHRGLSAFVSTGVLFGHVMAQTDNPAWAEFDDRLENERERLDGVQRSYRSVPVELGGDYRFALGQVERLSILMLVQYRLGYAFQVLQGEWATQGGRTLDGGPGIDTTGMWGRLGLGVAL